MNFLHYKKKLSQKSCQKLSKLIKIAIKSPNRLMHARKTPLKKLKISMNRVKMSLKGLVTWRNFSPGWDFSPAVDVLKGAV